jgi:hypothetical protein
MALAQLPAMATQNAVLSWSPSADTSVAGYKIYFGDRTGNYPNAMDVGNVTNATITGLADGSTNYFVATTYDAASHESTRSAEVIFVAASAVVVVPTNPPTVVPPVTNPPSVSNPSVLNTVVNVVASTNAADSHSCILSWDASKDVGVTGYHIFGGTNSGNYNRYFTVGLTNSLVVTGLVTGTTSYFSVRAMDAAWNESPMSAEAVYVLPIPAEIPAPVETNTPPTQTNTPPSITNTPAVITNALPTLNPLNNLSLNMGSSLMNIPLTGISSGSPDESQTLVVTATSSNPKLVAVQRVNYISPATNGILVLKTAAGVTGSALITVTVTDSGSGSNSVTQSFSLTSVNPNLIAALPKIVRQPSNVISTVGKNVNLSVAVSGKAPFKFQWKHDGTNIPNAKAPTLLLNKIKLSQAGKYSVFISNAFGVTNSVDVFVALSTYSPATAASIAVNPAPTMTAPVRTAGGQFTFQVGGLNGGKYVVEASSDLKNWSAVQTNTAPFTFTDSTASSYGQRYYRSFYQP